MSHAVGWRWVVVVALPLTIPMAAPEGLGSGWWGAMAPNAAPEPPLTPWGADNDPHARIITDDPLPRTPNMVSVGWVGAGGSSGPPHSPPPSLRLPHWVPEYKLVKDTYWGTILHALHIAAHDREPPALPQAAPHLPQLPLHSPFPPKDPFHESSPKPLPTNTLTSPLKTPWWRSNTTAFPLTRFTPGNAAPRPGHTTILMQSHEPPRTQATKPDAPSAGESVKEITAEHNLGPLEDYLLEQLNEHAFTGDTGQVSTPYKDVTRRKADGHHGEDTRYLPWSSVGAAAQGHDKWTLRKDIQEGTVHHRDHPSVPPVGGSSFSHPPAGPETESYTHTWLHALIQNDLKNWGFPYDHSALEHLPPRYGFPWPTSTTQRPYKVKRPKRTSQRLSGHRQHEDPMTPFRNAPVATSNPSHLPPLSLLHPTEVRPPTSPSQKMPVTAVPWPNRPPNSLGRSSILHPTAVPLRKDDVRQTPIRALHPSLGTPLEPQERKSTLRHHRLPYPGLRAPPQVRAVGQAVAPEPRVLGFGPPKGDDIISMNKYSSSTDDVLSDFAGKDLPNAALPCTSQNTAPTRFIREPQPLSHIIFKDSRPLRSSQYTTQVPSTTTTTTTASPNTTTTTGPVYIPWPNPRTPPLASSLLYLPFLNHPFRRPSLPNLNFLDPFNLFRSQDTVRNTTNIFPFVSPPSSSSSSLSSTSSYTNDSETSSSLSTVTHKALPTTHFPPSPQGTHTHLHTKHTRPQLQATESTLLKLPRGTTPLARPTNNADPPHVHPHPEPHIKHTTEPTVRATRSPFPQSSSNQHYRYWPIVKYPKSKPLVPSQSSFQPITPASWSPIPSQKSACESLGSPQASRTWPSMGTLTPKPEPCTYAKPSNQAKRSPKHTHFHVIRGIPIAVLREEVPPQATPPTHHTLQQGKHSLSIIPQQKRNANPQFTPASLNLSESTFPSVTLLPPPFTPPHHTQSHRHDNVRVDIEFPRPQLIKFTIDDVIYPSNPRPKPQTRREMLDSSARPRDLSLSSSEQVVMMVRLTPAPAEESTLATETVTAGASQTLTTEWMETGSNTPTTSASTTLHIPANSRTAPRLTTSALTSTESYQHMVRASKPLQSPLPTYTPKPSASYVHTSTGQPPLSSTTWTFTHASTLTTHKPLHEMRSENMPLMRSRNKNKHLQERGREESHSPMRESFPSPTSQKLITIEATQVPKSGEAFPTPKYFRTFTSTSSTSLEPNTSSTPTTSPLPSFTITSPTSFTTKPTERAKPHQENCGKTVVVSSPSTLHLSTPPSPTTKTRNIPPALLMSGKYNHRTIMKPPQTHSDSSSQTDHRVPILAPQKKMKSRYNNLNRVTSRLNQHTSQTPLVLGRSTAVALPVEKTLIDTGHSLPATTTRVKHTGHPFTTTYLSALKEMSSSHPFNTTSLLSPAREDTEGNQPFPTTTLSVPQEKHISSPITTTFVSAHRQNQVKSSPLEAKMNEGEESRRVDFTLQLDFDDDDENKKAEEKKEGKEDGIGYGTKKEEEQENRRKDEEVMDVWKEQTETNEPSTTVATELPQITTTSPRPSSMQRVRDFMARKRKQMRDRTTTTTAIPTTTTTTTQGPPQNTTNARRFPGLSTTSYRTVLANRRKTTAASSTTTTTTTTTTRIPRHHSRSQMAESNTSGPTGQHSIPESSQVLPAEGRTFKDLTDLNDFLGWESTRLRPTKGDEESALDLPHDITAEGSSMSLMAMDPPGQGRDALGPRGLEQVRGTTAEGEGGVQVSPHYASVGWSRSSPKAVGTDKTRK